MIPAKYALKGCQSTNAKRLFASMYKNRDTTKKTSKAGAF